MIMSKHEIFHVGIKALIVNDAGEILLLRVNEAELKDNQHGSYYDIPGGRIEKGMNALDTLAKELKEETGITSYETPEFFHASIANIRIPVDNDTVGLILLIYRVQILPHTSITLSSEHTSFEWLYPGKASELLKVKYPTDFTNKIRNLDTY